MAVEGVDESLWFEPEDGHGRDFLFVGNPHTYPGRMAAYCPHRAYPWFNVSLKELGNASEACKAFAQGFICGSEPAPPADDDGFELDEATAEYERWDRMRRQYRVSGEWPDD